jgi:hypothetical protein
MAESTGSTDSTGSTSTLDTIEIDLGDGAVLHAVVRDDRPRRDSGDAGAVSAAVRHSFKEVRDTIQAVGTWAKETAVNCGDPSGFEVEFGLTLSVKSGQLIGVLAEAGGKASLVVRLSWDRDAAGRQ